MAHHAEQAANGMQACGVSAQLRLGRSSGRLVPPARLEYFHKRSSPWQNEHLHLHERYVRKSSIFGLLTKWIGPALTPFPVETFRTDAPIGNVPSLSMVWLLEESCCSHRRWDVAPLPSHTVFMAGLLSSRCPPKVLFNTKLTKTRTSKAIIGIGATQAI